MNNYKALIIDDEHFAQQGLKKVIQHALPDFFVSIDTASSVKEGVEKIKENKPDIVFLDIQMPEEFGFKLFDYFNDISFDVIFTTAHSDYILQAVNQWGCLGYLMKPISISDLKILLQRFEERQNDINRSNKIEIIKEDSEEEVDTENLKEIFKNEHGIIFIPSITEVLVLKINEIIYCKADDSYCTIYTKDDTFMITKTLKEVENLINQTNFFRVNRSYLVNINFAKKIDKRNNQLILNCSPKGGEINLPVTSLGYKILSNVVS
ncbi:LytTR family DNA-binding domain-containing protein [Empedobacter tilapiae]|uniref:LytR/AlgR family response regulator transcription factor n=1 Tax=Empedobacter tilapiae TaxID=2491114 RepID=UPI0028D5AB01|nr:LytTR family DNA-binding domain-containing protein [Empedobacter tilapiae]